MQIRTLELADLPQLQALYAEPEALRNTLVLPFQSLEHWQSKLGKPAEGFMAIVAVEGDEVMGQLSLTVLQHPRRRHVATFGMGVKASATGRGIGSALVQAAIAHAEQWANVSRIEIEVYTDNAPAIALYRKHGFAIEGTASRYAFRDGAYVDVHFMSRLKPL